jgi:hypothetical protein
VTAGDLAGALVVYAGDLVAGVLPHLFARLDRIHHEFMAALLAVDHNQEQVLLSGLPNEIDRFSIAFGIQLKALPVPIDESERLAL